jgi:hypothetical protein
VTEQRSCLDIASSGEQDFSWNKGVLQEVDIGSLHSFGARIRGQIILQHVGRRGFQRIPEGVHMRGKVSFRFALIFAICLGVVIAMAPPAPSAHADVVNHARIVRLSFVEGDVAFQRPGSTWQRAVANLPIQQDFSLRTDTGYAEVEFETGLVVHLAGNTQLEFTELSLIDGRRVTSLKLDQGTIIATANLQRGDQVSISSGSAVVMVPRNGRFRIDAVESQNWVTVFHGRVDVANGATNTDLESGKTLHFGPALQGGAENQSSVDRSPRTDAFDKWAAQREQAQQDAQSDSGDFVRPRDYTFSTADLYNYGLWSNISGYGMAWQPYGLGANWMPFDNGMWMFDGSDADWMWTSFEPWGWLPYHYGGWVYIDGAGWFWIPQELGTFRRGTANFVNVGNQVGWTPRPATPVNPGKIKTGPSGPVQVVFAGKASNGVILAGPRGVPISPATVKTVSVPVATFAQRGEPTISALAVAGVTPTGRSPVVPVGTTLTYAAHGTAIGTRGVNNGTRGTVGAPVGRPMASAPHSAPVAVVRAPSTFATGSNSAGRNSGVTPVNSGGSGGGSHSVGGVTGTQGAPGTSSASNGGSGGHPTGPTGGTAPTGTGMAPGGTAPTGKH